MITRTTFVGLKGPKQHAARRTLFAEIRKQTRPSLHVARGIGTVCEEVDHALDALIAALIARAVALGACEPMPSTCADVAKREGWIAVPKTGSLARLVN